LDLAGILYLVPFFSSLDSLLAGHWYHWHSILTEMHSAKQAACPSAVSISTHQPLLHQLNQPAGDDEVPAQESSRRVQER
jgi:hypothetical protein